MVMKPAEDGRRNYATRVLDGAMGRSGAESRGATRARNGHTAALFQTEAPAISTRPGLPTFRARTVGRRSQRGSLFSWGPNALYQGPPSITRKIHYDGTFY